MMRIPDMMRTPGVSPAYVLIGLFLAGLAMPAQGQELLADASMFDVQYGDAHLETLFAVGLEDHLDEAANLYWGLLSSLDRPLSAQERTMLNRHIAQLALILPEDVRRQLFDGDPEMPPESWSFKDGIGARLTLWWRSQDPLPATRNNERLEEHLERVAYAEAKYPHEDRLTRLDDRGEIYVRYGAPSEKETISFNSLSDDFFRPGVVVNLTDFPDNEFWGYGHIDRAAYFLFVKKDGEYQIAATNELLPNTLRFGFSASARGRRKVTMMLNVAEEIYRQLAPLHPDFMLRYSDVVDYARGLEDGSLSAQAGTAQVFAERLLLQAQVADEEAAGRRETYTPRQATEVFRETENLLVAVRTARFLDEDGVTRTEIYWSPQPGALTPTEQQREVLDEQGHASSERYVVKLTAVQKAEEYIERVVNVRHYYITDLPATASAVIPVQTMVVKGDTGRYHLALQWDQHVPADAPADAPGDEENVTLGPRLKVATHQVDSLTALAADEGVLEMSDLRLEFVPESEKQAGRFETMPYPFEAASEETLLGLYFEVYHLVFDADDQTHYKIAYTLEPGDDEGGGLLNFLGGRPDQQTTVETSYTGADRMAQVSILLDLSEWKGNGALNVTVRVTDVTTGQQVERSLQFIMRK